jgi:hypothetical protein
VAFANDDTAPRQRRAPHKRQYRETTLPECDLARMPRDFGVEVGDHAGQAVGAEEALVGVLLPFVDALQHGQHFALLAEDFVDAVLIGHVVSYWKSIAGVPAPTFVAAVKAPNVEGSEAALAVAALVAYPKLTTPLRFIKLRLEVPLST